MYKNYLLLVFALFMGLEDVTAGNAPEPPAYVLHLDKSFYVNGEVMWYKLLMPADRRHDGIAVKAVLTDRRGSTLFYTFLKNPGATYVAGYYKIPFDLPTGMYRLSFLASDADTGESFTLLATDLPIFNDSEAVPAAAVRNAPGVAAWALPPDAFALKVDIDLSADTIRSRNQMQAAVSVTDADGRPVNAHISIAVTDKQLMSPAGVSATTVVPGITPPNSRSLASNISMPAVLNDYNGRALTANVLGVLAPMQKRIHYTRTQSPGKVNLQLPDFYGRQTFQFLGLPQEEDSIRVSLPADRIQAPTAEVVYTPEILEYLEMSRRRKKIFQLYTDLEFNLQPQLPEVPVQELKPERVVRVKDYESFDNVYLFFKEILTPLVFRQVKGEVFEAKVFTDKGNRVYEMLSGAPLFIIDGQATRDGNYIAHMKTDMLETVEIYTDRSELRRQFNVLGGSGVVIINTSSSDITVPDTDADDIVELQGLQAPAAFPAFSPEQFGNDRHRPFFRPQLYWEPGLKTDASGRAAASFYQSDANGDFQIRVLVQDDQGRIGYAEKTYYAAW